ncbi:hypothetical protein HDV05_008565 [Chytridiales sp. JEL 0842]|nr:hypothetical protein HDV05_008565 [Chytridiales sp. JEL 0842]
MSIRANDNMDYDEDEDDAEDIIMDKEAWNPSFQQASTTGSSSSSSSDGSKTAPPIPVPKYGPFVFPPLPKLSEIDIVEYKIEFAFLVSVVVYIAAHFYGRQVNLKIAKGFMQAALPVLQLNFAKVGDEKKHTLMRDGPKDYIFFASGREFVQSLYGYIQLMSRFDYIEMGLDYLQPTSRKEDRVVIEVKLDKDLQGTVFALIDKTQASRIEKSRYDLADFALSRNHPRLPKSKYVLMSDCPEFAQAVMADEEIVSQIWASTGLTEDGKGKAFVQPLIESIIISDQLVDLPEKPEDIRDTPRWLTATFIIDKDASPNVGAGLMKLVLNLIDVYGQLTWTLEGKNKLKKIRQACEEKIIKKQLEAHKKQLAEEKAKALKEKEDELLKMTPEQQRKYEEKKHKKDLKKRMKKGVMRM